MISLAKRLQSLGKAPPFRNHDTFVLTGINLKKKFNSYGILDEELVFYTARVITAEEQGIDWTEIHDECHTVESADSPREISSVIAEDTLENVEETVEIEVVVEKDSLPALRDICKSTNLANELYEADFGKCIEMTLITVFRARKPKNSSQQIAGK